MENNLPKAVTLGGFLAIKPIEVKKVSPKIKGGLATISEQTEVITIDLVMDYKHPDAKRYLDSSCVGVILRGSAGQQPWNRQVLEWRGQKFVLCPLAEVLGYELSEQEEEEDGE